MTPAVVRGQSLSSTLCQMRRMLIVQRYLSGRADGIAYLSEGLKAIHPGGGVQQGYVIRHGTIAQHRVARVLK